MPSAPTFEARIAIIGAGFSGLCLAIQLRKAGKITNNWYGSTVSYWWRTRKPDFGAYELRRA